MKNYQVLSWYSFSMMGMWLKRRKNLFLTATIPILREEVFDSMVRRCMSQQWYQKNVRNAGRVNALQQQKLKTYF